MAIFPAVALAEGLAIEQPASGQSWTSMPLFSGSSNGTFNGVTLSLYSGYATSGTALEESTVVPSGTAWSTTPEPLAPGTYTAVARQSNEAFAEEFSNPVTITIVAPATKPQVVTSPTSQKADPGTIARFHASASGTEPITVRWEVKAGANWEPDSTDSGNTSDELSVLATSDKNGYEYRAVFENSAGEATTGYATLLVPPTVEKQPASQVVNAGESATFTLAASGTPAPTIQWWRRKGPHAGWEEIHGAVSTTLTVANTNHVDGEYEFGALFTNSGGSTGTGAATLTVVESPPAVTTSPQSTTVGLGESAEFKAGASGAPPPKVQWEESRARVANWHALSGATSTSFTTPRQKVEGEFAYRARFENGVGQPAYTQEAVLTVTSPQPPSVLVNPHSTTVPSGGTAIFTAAATGPPPPSIQWEESSDGGATWSAIPGATADELTIAGASTAEGGHEYRALFTNDEGSATSTSATLTVTPPPPSSPPTVSTLPGLTPGFSFFPATPRVGETVTFASTSTDAASPIISFAWDFAGNGSYVPGSPLATTSFAMPGPHVVHLRASAANGVTREVGQTINVLARQASLIQPFPIVRMVGSLISGGVKVSLLTVQAPAGSLVSARCVGKRCPLKLERVYALARAGSTRVPPVTLWRFQRFLRSGVVLQIKISKAGQVGKYTSFTIRRGKVPVRLDECLDPTWLTPMVCPSS